MIKRNWYLITMTILTTALLILILFKKTDQPQPQAQSEVIQQLEEKPWIDPCQRDSETTPLMTLEDAQKIIKITIGQGTEPDQEEPEVYQGEVLFGNKVSDAVYKDKIAKIEKEYVKDKEREIELENMYKIFRDCEQKCKLLDTTEVAPIVTCLRECKAYNDKHINIQRFLVNFRWGYYHNAYECISEMLKQHDITLSEEVAKHGWTLVGRYDNVAKKIIYQEDDKECKDRKEKK